jgi:hypothetical protein
MQVKTATKQFTAHLDQENIISSKQFGFRKQHSTIHPLIITRDFIEKSRNLGNFTILVTLDLSKAFDTVNTEKILPDKLAHYGCSEKTENWFKSFFKDRSQYVTWEDHESETTNLHNISVVQGSSIGPQCFSIYINDLAEATKFKTILFADDTNLLISGKNLKELAAKANNELESVRQYMAANKLSLNVKKTDFMVFNPVKKGEKRTEEDLQIVIGQQKLEEVKEVKFLGVILDNQLKFDSHASKVINKVRSGLTALNYTKHLLNYKAKLLIYNSIIKSHVEYCSLVWLYKISKKQQKILTILQKKQSG